jgi:monofunctional biosynthetic peptidoglycan transglycosylase
MTTHRSLVTFAPSEDVSWSVIDDVVMGGVSRSRMHRTERNTGLFEGELSLENNGGFASVRADLGRLDLSGFTGLVLRVRGDGRTYQVRLRTDDRFDGIAYRARFATRDDAWQTHRIAFDAFTPTFRGRNLSDVPPLDRRRIHQLGFMPADRSPGPFSLEIDFVDAWHDGDETSATTHTKDAVGSDGRP